MFVPTEVSSELEVAVADGLLGLGFHQLNGQPNSFGNVLDTVFSTRFYDLSLMCPAPALCTGFGSSNAHNPVELDIAGLRRSPASSGEPSESRYDFKRANYPALLADLASTHWSEILVNDDPDSMVARFYNHLYCVLDRHVPKSTRRRQYSQPWMSQALARLRNRRRAAGRRAAKTRSTEDVLQYHADNAAFIEQSEVEQAEYLRRLGEKLISDPRKFWAFVDERRKCAGFPPEMTLGQVEASGNLAISDLFAQHFSSVYSTDNWNSEALSFEASSIGSGSDQLSRPFTHQEVLKALKKLDAGKGAGPDLLPPRFWKAASDVLCAPLTVIFNASIACGVFPSRWKQAYVTAIFKSGLRSKVENYRPISILSCPGKVLDALMCDRFTEAFSSIITDEQHGFLKVDQQQQIWLNLCRASRKPWKLDIKWTHCTSTLAKLSIA